MGNRILLDNIYYLIKKEGMKVGEFEKRMEVSNGYFSRLNKESRNNPTLDLVEKISYFFGIGIDFLVRVNLDKLSTTELNIMNLVEKLASEASKDTTQWSSITEDDLTKLNTFIVSEFYKKNNISSRYEDFYDQNKVYSIKINDSKIFLVNIFDNLSYDDNSEYEMYFMYNDGSIERIYQYGDCIVLNERVRDLYYLVASNVGKPRISDRAFKMIEEYMNSIIKGGDEK